MNLRQAAQQALEALDWHLNRGAWGADIEGVTEVLRAALAEPEQEPVAWQCSECGGTHLLCPHGRKDVPLYTAPQRKPLTDEEIGKIAGDTLDAWSCARAIEKAHGIGDQL